jgi:phytoene dehydrogenase-like protein
MKKIIVVGAGIAGMSVGALLAKAGEAVTIIEQEDRIMGRAGAIRGEDIKKKQWLAWMMRQGDEWISKSNPPVDELIDGGYLNGYELDLAFHSWAHGDGGRPNQIFKYLGVDLEFKSQEPLCWYKDKIFPLPTSPEGFFALAETGYITKEEIEKFVVEGLGTLMAQPISEYAKLNNLPLRTFLNQFTYNVLIHDLLEALAVTLGTVMDPFQMPTGEFLRLLRSIIETQKNSGLPIGGMLGVAGKVKNIFESYGGKIILEATVNKIIIEDGKTAGVIFTKGGKQETLSADIVVCNVPVQRMVRSNLIDHQYLPAGFIKNAKYTRGGGGVCGFFGINSPKVIPEQYRDKLFLVPIICEKFEGDFEWDPRLCAQLETAVDPNKAPSGKDLMSSFTIVSQEGMHIPSIREKIANGHLETLEKMFPGFLKALDWYFFTTVPFGVGLEMSIRGLNLRYRDVELPTLKNCYFVGDTVEGWGCGMDGAVLSSVLVSDKITGLNEIGKILPSWLGRME